MRERVRRLAIAVGLALFALASPGSTALAVDKWVTMYANEYRPGVVTINVGDTVTWVNDDDVEHDAVGNGWSTSLLGYYESDSVTFRRAGRYNYHCSIHPQMRSAVVVRGAGGGATVPPTDTVASTTDRSDPPGSWLAVPVVLIAGSALLLALVWPRRGRAEA
jgi:plastocyanin